VRTSTVRTSIVLVSLVVVSLVVASLVVASLVVVVSLVLLSVGAGASLVAVSGLASEVVVPSVFPLSPASDCGEHMGPHFPKKQVPKVDAAAMSALLAMANWAWHFVATQGVSLQPIALAQSMRALQAGLLKHATASAAH
jgi:hypothetical protein